MTNINLTFPEEQLLFHFQHSLGMTQFAYLEEHLAALVTAEVAGAPGAALHIAFFGIENFRSKLEFADRTMEVRLKERKELLHEWKQLHAGHLAVSAKRNKFAHWSAMHYPSAKAGRRLVLLPHPLKPSDKNNVSLKESHAGSPPSIGLGFMALKDARIEAFDLSMRMLRFYAKITNGQDPVPTYRGPPEMDAASVVQSFRDMLRASAAGT
jgi:hypothetical protein